jgi:hypothetical protein
MEIEMNALLLMGAITRLLWAAAFCAVLWALIAWAIA